MSGLSVEMNTFVILSLLLIQAIGCQTVKDINVESEGEKVQWIKLKNAEYEAASDSKLRDSLFSKMQIQTQSALSFKSLDASASALFGLFQLEKDSRPTIYEVDSDRKMVQVLPILLLDKIIKKDQIPAFFYVSNDGTKFAIGISTAGSDITDLYLFNRATGSLQKIADNTSKIRVMFTPDSNGLLFRRLDGRSTTDKSKAFFGQTVRYIDISNKIIINGSVVFDHRSLKDHKFDGFEFIDFKISSDSKRILVGVQSKPVKDNIVFEKSLKDILKMDAPWTKILDLDSEVTNFIVLENSVLYLSANRKGRETLFLKNLTTANALSVKVFEVDSGSILDLWTGPKGTSYFIQTHLTNSSLFRLDSRKLLIEKISTKHGFAADMVSNFWNPIAYVSIQSFTNPSLLMELNHKRGTLNETAPIRSLILPFEVDMQVFEAPSTDGVKVPMILLRSKGARQTKNPHTLISSYGAHGFITLPSFPRAYTQWLASGGVLVHCLPRGGGDLGPKWHQEGRGVLKMNSVIDTAACGSNIDKLVIKIS